MPDYHQYRERLRGLSFPYAVVDMELLRQNMATNLARAGEKRIRLASKSIRCRAIMQLIFEYHEQFQGIMTYHGREALFLAEQGFDDLLMGYPVTDLSLLKAIATQVKKGTTIRLMVDSEKHLELAQEAAKTVGCVLPICLDVDLSDNYPGLRFGVWRSSITNQESLARFLAALKSYDRLRLDSIMGYEAQVAGVGDQLNGQAVKNWVIRQLKRRSINRLREKRAAAVAMIEAAGHSLVLVNGGGTGSLESTRSEATVTEVTVGSGFYNSHLFDYYQQFSLQPALFYGIEIVRQPKPGIYTCHGGGFIASGATEGVKAPIVHLPQTGQLDTLEGAGEVQTPIRFKQLTQPLQIGDPVYLRHSKAGELCERFNTLHLLDGDTIRTVLTYRGEGVNFG